MAHNTVTGYQRYKKLNKPKYIQKKLDEINLQYNTNSFIIPNNNENKLNIYIDSEVENCNDIKYMIDELIYPLTV